MSFPYLCKGGTIEARSLEDMSGGAGKMITYDKATGEYSGYGQKEQ